MARLFKVLFVNIILGLTIYFVMSPTFYWYFNLSDYDKSISKMTTKQLSNYSRELNEDLGKLRSIIPRNRHRIKSKEDDRKYIFNISPRSILNEEYNISFEYKKDVLNNLNISFEESKSKDFQKEFNALFDSVVNKRYILKRFKELSSIKKNVIKLGLDLLGGTQLVLAVNKKDIIYSNRIIFKDKGLIDNNLPKSILDNKFDDSKFSFNDSVLFEGLKSKFTSDQKESIKDIKDIEKYPKLQEVLISKKKNLIESYKNNVARQLKVALDDILLIIRDRVDRFGVSEVSISKGFNDTIIVEIPGLDNNDVTDSVKVITDVGDLSFKIVDEELMHKVPAYMFAQKRGANYIDAAWVEFNSSDNIYNLKYDKRIDNPKIFKSSKELSGVALYPVQVSNEYGIISTVGYLFLKNRDVVKGSNMTNAFISYSGLSPNVSFELNSIGSSNFYSSTKDNIGNRMAIVLDGGIKSAPYINDAIGSKGSITLGRNPKITELQRLVSILKAGALPSSLTILSKVSVSSSVGYDNVISGLYALALGFVMVSFLMVIYYKVLGLISVLALLCNLITLVFCLSSFGFTITLFGVAGIVLTIGMSIDANIIIFERIKEEMLISDNYSMSKIVDKAFSKAFSAILDANITTIIVAFILSQVGFSLLKGFGFTLMWGVICSMLSSLVYTRFMIKTYVGFKFKKIYI